MNTDDKTTEPAIAVPSANMQYARAGYEAYARFTGGKTFDGRAMPTFNALEQRIKDAWAAAAMGIFVEASRAPDPILVPGGVGEIDLVLTMGIGVPHVHECEAGKAYEIGPEGVRELTSDETKALHDAQPCELADPAAEGGGTRP